ncbi:MAG: hypothetical protein H7A41_07365 [Chlamydiales bacterium]|nr:hypothetical protein [Chlamydiales bacterium]
MNNLSHSKEISQGLRKHLMGGLLFSAPRLFWETMDRKHFPLCNLFLKRALVAAMNQKKNSLHLIREENFSPLNLSGRRPSILKGSPRDYLRKGLDQLKLKNLPPLSLVTSSQDGEKLKETWERELGIECQLNSSLPQQLAFVEWSDSDQDPLLRLAAFKRATDKLKPKGNNWEHPGYPTLFEKAKRETDPQKGKDLMERLEEMVLQNLSILPLFYQFDKAVKLPK